MIKAILVVNTGSSSIKFAFLNFDTLELEFHGAISNINSPAAEFCVKNKANAKILTNKIQSDYPAAFNALFSWLNTLSGSLDIVAVGHRIVHGGAKFLAPIKLDAQILHQLAEFIPLAPLHQPHNLEAVKIISQIHPDLIQIGCFDTAFHKTQTKIATLFALPKELTQQGIIRYGFHGLSYEYISTVLPEYIGTKANGKIIVAHLGNGASACALLERKSLATTMGFTALDGLMMGTRCGTIDPGVLLYLLQNKSYTPQNLQDLLYNQSGLLGVSGLSNDMSKLENTDAVDAAQAIDLFCFKAAREFGSLITILKGCDGIVFTAGIGENSARVRAGICAWLEWMGVKLEFHANAEHKKIISSPESKIVVAVIPTNEEYMVAMHVKSML